MIPGPPGLRAIKGFHDEAFCGEWKGHPAVLEFPGWDVLDSAA
jgi:hypothetical protein